MTDLDRTFPWLATFNKRLAKLDLIDNIVLAVSGGSDSMALLHIVSRWKRALKHKACPRLVCTTVNHGLRPEAAQEARDVSAWACELGIEHRTLKWVGEKPTSSIQDMARGARYRLIGDLIHRLPGQTVVLTGHTRDDQAETVMMRLTRGSGPEGLAGIAATTYAHGYHLHRPLLDLSREELRMFLRSIGVKWLNDPSNEATIFERIRVRRNKPTRRALGLEDKPLARTAWRMSRANSALNEIAYRFLSERVQQDGMLQRYGIFRWDRLCRDLPEEIALRVLRRIVRSVGGQSKNPNLGQTEQLFEKIKEVDFLGATLAGCRAVRCSKKHEAEMLLFRESGRAGLPRFSLTLRAPTSTIWDRRFRLTFKAAEAARCDIEIAALGSHLSGLRARHPVILQSLPALPADALKALPGIYVQGELVAAPSLGLCQSGYQVGAKFLVKNLFDIFEE